jgi:hypothetical protein
LDVGRHELRALLRVLVLEIAADRPALVHDEPVIVLIPVV